MNTKIIKFDINKNLYDTLIAKQGDTKSRFLLFNLLDGSIPFSLENRSVRVYAVKPDRTEVFNDLIITDAAKGYCILELTTQMLAVAGTVKLELMVMEGDKKLTSNIFYMDVKESINSEKAVVSTNEFGALLTALQDVDNWNKEFTEKSGKLEELYTPRLNELGEQLDTKANEIVNIKEFGIVGQGDETSKLQSVIDLLQPGTLVVFSNINITISQPITLKSNIHLRFTNSKIITTQSNFKIFKTNVEQNYNITIDGLQNDSSYGVDLFGVDNLKFINCRFTNLTGSLYMRSLTNSLIENNFIENVTDGNMGIQIESSGSIVMNNVKILKNTVKNSGDNGIAVRTISNGFKNVIVSNNYIYNAGKAGIKITTETSNTGLFIENVIVSNNIIIGWGRVVSEAGISVGNYNSNDANIKEVVVSNNNIKSIGNNFEAFYIRIQKINGYKCIVANNICSGGCKLSGFFIENSKEIVVSSNIISEANQIDTGLAISNCAIYCGYVFDSIISNNTITNAGSNIVNSNGIGLAHCRRNSINGNKITDNRTTKYINIAINEFNNGSTTRSRYNHIINNYIDGYVSSAIYINTDNKSIKQGNVELDSINGILKIVT